MMTIGGDDTAPTGDARRVLITIKCDSEITHLFEPVVKGRCALETPRIAISHGWTEVDDDRHGRVWLCPACKRSRNDERRDNRTLRA